MMRGNCTLETSTQNIGVYDRESTVSMIVGIDLFDLIDCGIDQVTKVRLAWNLTLDLFGPGQCNTGPVCSLAKLARSLFTLLAFVYSAFASLDQTWSPRGNCFVTCISAFEPMRKVVTPWELLCNSAFLHLSLWERQSPRGNSSSEWPQNIWFLGVVLLKTWPEVGFSSESVCFMSSQVKSFDYKSLGLTWLDWAGSLTQNDLGKSIYLGWPHSASMDQALWGGVQY